jgi:hypothetical protein
LASIALSVARLPPIVRRHKPATTADRGEQKWKCIMEVKNEVSGVAALSICELLLLCLSDNNILK